MKLCVVTWYYSINYGTCLQCYALTRFLSELGHEVYVPESYMYYYGKKHPVQTVKKMMKSIKSKVNDQFDNNKNIPKEVEDSYKLRTEKNRKFAYKYNNVISFKSRKAFVEFVISTDAFITGSDQIWNPKHVSPPFLLSIAPYDKKKIAYGSSLGISNLSERDKKIYRKYLNRFDNVGVREKTAESLLKQFVNKEIKTVLDPTFLLNDSEWNELVLKNDCNFNVEEKYIFCYFIGNNSQWESQVEQFAASLDLKIKIATSESFVLPKIGEANPSYGVEEFVSLIKNAEFVVTDSFHACTLSIIMKKELFIYKRFNDKDLNSQNSRIYDLVSMLNLEQRILDKDSNIKELSKNKIDYQIIGKKLDDLISKSKRFLINSIEGKEYIK